MRKLIVYLVLLAAVLASCSKNCGENLDSGTCELSFSSVCQNDTKGYVRGVRLEDTAFDSLHTVSTVSKRSIWMSSYMNPDGPASGVSGSIDSGNYFEGQEFVCGNNGYWHHSPSIYWPLDSSLEFLAYSVTREFDPSDVRWNSENVASSVTLSVGDEYLQDDILYAFASGTSRNGADAVPMKFYHSQAWLEFKLSVAAASLSDVVTLKRIVLEDIYVGGELTVTGGGNADASWDFRFERGQDTDVPDTYGILDGTLGVSPKYMDMLLPEQNRKSFVIYYTLSGQSDIELAYRFRLDESAWWEKGGKYVYDICISGNEVKVSPEVGNWEERSEDIPPKPSATYHLRDVSGEVSLPPLRLASGTSLSIDWGDGNTVRYQENTKSDIEFGQLQCLSHNYASRFSGRVSIYVLKGCVDFGATAGDDFADLLITDSTQVLTRKVNALQFSAPSKQGVSLMMDGVSPSLEYSYDAEEWTVWDGSRKFFGTGPADRKLFIRGKNPDGFSISVTKIARFFFSDKTVPVDCKGNVMSLLDWEDEDLTALPSIYCFASLFSDCTSLVSAPELPATVLTNYCYCDTFLNCTSLQDAPALPATVLFTGCYSNMFRGCSSLKNAPVLPAPKLEKSSYKRLFTGCSALNRVKILATDTSQASCLENWLENVAPSGTLVKSPGMNSFSQNSASGIPEGWTVVDDD